MNFPQVLDWGGLSADGADLLGPDGHQPALLALEMPAAHIEHRGHHPGLACWAHARSPAVRVLVVTLAALVPGLGLGLGLAEAAQHVSLGVLQRPVLARPALRVWGAPAVTEAVSDVDVSLLGLTSLGLHLGQLLDGVWRADNLPALGSNPLTPLASDPLKPLPAALEVAGGGGGQAEGRLVGGRGEWSVRGVGGVGSGDRRQGPDVVKTLELGLEVFRQLLGLETDVADGAHGLAALGLEPLAGGAAEVLRLLVLGLQHQLGAAGHGGQGQEGIEGEAGGGGRGDETVCDTGLGPGEQRLLLEQGPQVRLWGQAQVLGQGGQSRDHDDNVRSVISKLVVTAHWGWL